MWSIARFRDPEIAGYAEQLIRPDTRLGLQILAALSIVAQASIAVVAILVMAQASASMVVNTNILVGLLSLHILISAAFVDDIRALHMLGIVFFVVSAVAVTVLAHRFGDLSIGMSASIVMLFVAIPLIPWALREVLTVIALTYALLTASLLSVPGRFDFQSLVVLQLLIVGSALAVVVVTGRNTLIRKHDIRARHSLESAQHRLRTLSMQDHLTGVWNRRYLAEQYSSIYESCRTNNQSLQVAVMDIDGFKLINDTYGHSVGDQVLVKLAGVFVQHIGQNGHVIRLGGDEFQILYIGSNLREIIDDATSELQVVLSDEGLLEDATITLSAGIVSADMKRSVALEDLFKAADDALYSAKNQRHLTGASLHTVPSLVQSGRWKI